MSENTYNGWYNRATWLVALWFGNDRGLYEWLQEEIEECIAQRLPLNQAECRIINFLQDYIQEDLDKIREINPIIADYIDIDDEIDYGEVAESFLEDYEQRLAEVA